MEAVLEVILADLGPARDDALAGLALEVAKDVPVLLVPLQVLPHLLVAEVVLVVDLLAVSLAFPQAVDAHLDAAAAEIVAFSVVQLALAAALHCVGLDEQEVADSAVVL